MDHPKFENLIWLHTGFLGDLIICTAAIHLAKKVWPSVSQQIITTPIGAEIFTGHQDLQQIHVYDKRRQPGIKGFKSVKDKLKVKGSSSILLQPHKSYRSSALALYLGIPRITYSETKLNSGALHKVPRVSLFHEAQRVALLLEPLGIPRSAMVGIKPTLQHSIDGHREVFQQLGLPASSSPILIAPGSVWGDQKMDFGRILAAH